MRTLLALLMTGVVVLSACGGGQEADDAAPATTTPAEVPPTVTATPTTGPTPGPTASPPTPAAGATATEVVAVPELDDRCERVGVFTVAYPSSWFTNDADIVEPCTVFHPEQLSLEPATELPSQALSFIVDAVAFDVVTDMDGDEVVSRSETTIDGVTAVRTVAVRSGEGLLDAGTETTVWAFDLPGDETLIASTADVGDSSYALRQEVLDAMAASLEFPAT